jgi:hypothetical protein
VSAPLSNEELAALDAVVTGGIWEHLLRANSHCFDASIMSGDEYIAFVHCGYGPQDEDIIGEDAASIVALHNAYPALRATIDAERARVDAAEARIVAWLRQEGARALAQFGKPDEAALSEEAALSDAADAIERGVHRSNDHDER